MLTLLAAPLTVEVLDRLAQGPRRLAQLRRETGSPPATTLRSRVRALLEVGAVARRRLHPFPSVREHVLTNGAGAELRFVAATLEAWLAAAPGGAVRLGEEPAQAAVKALVQGWSTGMLRALAERPQSLDQLDAAIGTLSCQALQRRLGSLVDAGLVTEVVPAGRSGGPAYAVTDWLQRGAAPLAAAVRWERKHLSASTPPIAPIEAEAGFLLAVPLLRLPAEMSGTCRLAVEFQDAGEHRLAGVTVQVDGGRVAAQTSGLDSDPAAWATGPTAAWLRVAIEADPRRLELGGDERLARAVLDALNRALFGPAGRLPLDS